MSACQTSSLEAFCKKKRGEKDRTKGDTKIFDAT
jgi:hypothetical protein